MDPMDFRLAIDLRADVEALVALRASPLQGPHTLLNASSCTPIYTIR